MVFVKVSKASEADVMKHIEDTLKHAADRLKNTETLIISINLFFNSFFIHIYIYTYQNTVMTFGTVLLLIILLKLCSLAKFLALDSNNFPCALHHSL